MADSSKGILGELGEVPEHDFASLVSMIQMLSAELKLALGRQERALVELDTVEARAAEIFALDRDWRTVVERIVQIRKSADNIRRELEGKYYVEGRPRSNPEKLRRAVADIMLALDEKMNTTPASVTPHELAIFRRCKEALSAEDGHE